MIIVKSEREIELIRKAASILVEVRKILKDMIKPGVSLIELDRVAYKEILKRDAIPAFKDYEGFPNTLCLSVNDSVIHGIPNRYKLKSGDILSLDMGVIYKGYYSDSARTYPVGEVSDDVLKLLDVTRNALSEGVSKVKDGVYVGEISKAIQDYVRKYNYGIVKEFTGHGIGKDLHEDPYIPNYTDGTRGPALSKGCVICIEPMINMGKSDVVVKGWSVKTKDGMQSAHFEDMVLVTETGYEVLSADKE